VATDATFASVAGKYPIYFTNNAETDNYNFTYLPGVLTVESRGVVIVNTFTPNGDGTNDTWVIKNIEYYPQCSVNVFNRWGVNVFSSIGYSEQWNGRSAGNPVPAGAYYYVINLNDGSLAKAGWVAIIR
jgi:gliding motility-associated-like protein